MPPQHITSRQNPRIKQAVRLRSRRERIRRAQFLIDGAREIRRALAAGIIPREAFVCQPLCTSDDCQKVLAELGQSDAEILSVSPEVYAKLNFGERMDGIVVIANSPVRDLQRLRIPPTPLVAVLDRIEKPGNIGAILRSADAAGIDAVLVADAATDLLNPNTIRASLGTVFRENVCETSNEEAVQWLRERALPIYAARPDASLLYSDADFRGGAAFILGSEAQGLSDCWKEANPCAIRLPMLGLADSLNVSTTAAVLFYEALRQRRVAK